MRTQSRKRIGEQDCDRATVETLQNLSFVVQTELVKLHTASAHTTDTSLAIEVRTQTHRTHTTLAQSCPGNFTIPWSRIKTNLYFPASQWMKLCTHPVQISRSSLQTPLTTSQIKAVSDQGNRLADLKPSVTDTSCWSLVLLPPCFKITRLFPYTCAVSRFNLSRIHPQKC